MASIKALQHLSVINQMIAHELNRGQTSVITVRQPLDDIFTEAKTALSFEKVESSLDKAEAGDPKARRAILDIIYEQLTAEELNEEDIDTILSGYYINYYGGVNDIVSDCSSILFITQLNKIFIRSDSDIEIKLRKLAQICFQELYGIGPLDEFLNMVPDKNLKKIEEISYFGPNQLSLKISGLNCKLDKLFYPKEELERVAKRLAKTSGKGLNRLNCKIETELRDHSRITLVQEPIAPELIVTIRRHYPSTITPSIKIKIGSSTADEQNFLNALMYFHPRIIVIGPQGVGKTTDIRELVARYPRNTSISTVETSQELNLQSIPHLITSSLRAGVISNEKLMETLFRLNADCLIAGESRTPDDVFMYYTTSTRQTFGAASTWHSADAQECINQMASNLLIGNYSTSEYEAQKMIREAVDIIIVKSVVPEYKEKAGLRHTAQIVEVPKVPDRDGNYPPMRVLFEYDYQNWCFKRAATLSPEFLKLCNKRNYNPIITALLESGDYENASLRARNEYYEKNGNLKKVKASSVRR